MKRWKKNELLLLLLQVAEDLERDRDVIRQVKEEQVKRFEAMKEERRKRNSESNNMATSMNNSSR